MAEPMRSRMSRRITLVLLTSLPGIAGCCCIGANQEPMEEIDEVTETPPPKGPEHLIGGPFIGWWSLTHPTVVVRKTVPRSMATASTRSHGGTFIHTRPYYGGRSGFMSGGSSHGSSGITHGGFGSTGHASSGGS